MADEDAATFAAEPRGFTDIDDWRRDNVNRLIAAVYDSIQSVKNRVKFGIAPFGIWKNGVPPGIVGTSSYYELYCDPVAWLSTGTIDYVAPQLYWPHGGGQDYALLMPWWAGQAVAHDRQIYVGHAPYRISDWHNWPANELPNQIRRNRITEGSLGSIYFRYRSGIVNNPKGFLDSLRNDLYRYPALTPPMLWKDSLPPNPPLNVTKSLTDSWILWNCPPAAADGDTVAHYILYGALDQPIDTENPANIVAIISAADTAYAYDSTQPLFYALASLDRLNNESEAMDVLEPEGVNSPGQHPENFVLFQNYPNPFNPGTTLYYNLAETEQVRLSVYDMSGREVVVLFSGLQQPGEHTVRWQGKDAQGKQLSTGIYLAHLQMGGDSRNIKMVYLR